MKKNAQNIIEYFQKKDLAEVKLLLSNRPGAYALERAKALGVPAQLNLLEDGGHPPMSHMDEIYDIIDEYLKKQP